MKDLGPLGHFFGLSVTRQHRTMLLSRCHYILEILERAGMSESKPCRTPVETHSKCWLPMVHQLTVLLTIVVSPMMHDSRVPHLALVKRLLQYLRGTLDDVYCCRKPLMTVWLSTSMPIGLVVLTPGDLHMAMVFSLATTSSHGPLSGSTCIPH